MAQLIKYFIFVLSCCCVDVIATQMTYVNSPTGKANEKALGYPVPVPVNSLLPVDGFRDYDSLLARLQDIALSSDTITATRIGTSFEQAPIWAFILSDSDNTLIEGFALEGAFLQNGGIHAREWQTPEVVSGIIERFNTFQNDQGFYQYLLENTHMILIPVLNVDGFKQTQRYPAIAMYTQDQDDAPNWPRDGRMRRKNMRGVDHDINSETDNLFGVDLNRNNDPFWSTNPGRSSNRQSSIVYHGASAASEPETQALLTAAEIANQQLRLYIDTHSFTQVYFAPQTHNARRNEITANLASKMRAVNNNQYAYSPSPAGAGIGATDEYFATTYEIPAYTLETEPGNGGALQYGGLGVSHDGFILPESQINRVRNELANASILGYYMQSAPPSIVQLQITRIDNGQTVYLGHWQSINTTTREYKNPTHIDLSANVEYQLRVSFNKPMRWRNNGEISAYPGLSISSQPQINFEGLTNQDAAFLASITPYTSQPGTWLNQPENADNIINNGYLRYQDDSYAVHFILPDNSPLLDASLLQLAIQAPDLAGQQLDTSPQTIINWQQGAWSGYESTDGNQADSGGIDRSIRLIDDGSPAFFDPNAVVILPPPAPSPPTSQGGGGGLSVLLLGLLVLLVRLNLSSISPGRMQNISIY
ncbi:M14 family zinc carboxypeptidase [Aliikangiella maris]|uniref:M14 family zinc carboxypeptidase n=2 Tax=Aliikangiella maris TaxID=3162458 RepID=A0ABV2BWZ4_9GAMM